MTTPISPEPLPNTESGTLAPAIAAIVGGDFSRSRLASLSDLDRPRAAYLRRHWLDIPSTERHALLLALEEISDESLEFNFKRVFRVALGDPDPVIRQLAIRDLWEDEGNDLPGIYLDLLERDDSDDVRAAAADALSPACDAIAAGDSTVLDREELISTLSSLVQDAAESPTVRRRVLGAVAAFAADPRIVELIREALDDDDQSVVAGAVFAMGRTSDARWIPEILEFLQSEDAELRFEAARAAGLLAEVDVVPELAELIYDLDAEVRAAALDALGSIGGPAAIRALRQAELDDDLDDPEVVDAALEAALLTVDPLERQL